MKKITLAILTVCAAIVIAFVARHNNAVHSKLKARINEEDENRLQQAFKNEPRKP